MIFLCSYLNRHPLHTTNPTFTIPKSLPPHPISNFIILHLFYMAESLLFAKLSDDVVLCIFSKLEDDPRNWARLACVCTKFSSLIRNICWKAKCYSTIPSVVADLLSSSSSCGSVPPGGWSSLHKLAFCCPGLLQAGVLLEHSDFGLERELGPDENYRLPATAPSASKTTSPPLPLPLPQPQPEPECTWSLYDDLYNDTVYNASETAPQGPTASYYENDYSNKCNIIPEDVADNSDAVGASARGGEFSVTKRRKISRSLRSHLASGVWNLSREQGNKLLASRFRGDCLYICDWPGCVHIEEKRNYMLFRGVFRNFKKSRVWRTINDGNRNKIDLNCAFCGCKQTWDLHSAFCLRRVFGYHDDGEPVVRAYVCENGHVSGAWTDLPLYT